jgi:hypothetical protein
MYPNGDMTDLRYLVKIISQNDTRGAPTIFANIHSIDERGVVIVPLR